MKTTKIVYHLWVYPLQLYIPVIYIQLDGGHVGFCQDGGPLG